MTDATYRNSPTQGERLLWMAAAVAAAAYALRAEGLLSAVALAGLAGYSFRQAA